MRLLECQFSRLPVAHAIPAPRYGESGGENACPRGIGTCGFRRNSRRAIFLVTPLTMAEFYGNCREFGGQIQAGRPNIAGQSYIQRTRTARYINCPSCQREVADLPLLREGELPRRYRDELSTASSTIVSSTRAPARVIVCDEVEQRRRLPGAPTPRD